MRCSVESNTSSGPALGGLGTGGIELWPDGVFRHPAFLNPYPLTQGYLYPRKSGVALSKEPPFWPEDLFFLLRLQRGSERPLMRFLFVGQGDSFLSWNHMTRGFKYAFIPTVHAIESREEFPFIYLRYEDDRLPVEIELKAWSPWVPHDVEASSIPGAIFDFSVRNRSRDKWMISIIYSGTNLSGFDQKPHNQTGNHREYAWTNGLGVRMAGGQGCNPTTGDTTIFAQAGTGQKATCLKANNQIPNVMWPIYREGHLDGDLHLDRLRREEYAEGITATLEEGRCGPDSAYRNRAWLGLQCELSAKRATRLRFGMAWHYPHQFDRLGIPVGHYYSRRFADSSEVAQYLLNEGDLLLERTRVFNSFLAESNFPVTLRQTLFDQMNTLIKSTWLTESGDFYIWEGLGHACLNTVDVDHYGSFAVSLLFPELRRTVLRLIGESQMSDGQIAHGFQGQSLPQDIPPEEYQRWDVNLQFVLALFRDWRWTGDDKLLLRHYSQARRAMKKVNVLRDAHGLPWTEGGITYDHWHLTGIVAYMAGLYLAALQALSAMSRHLGEVEVADDLIEGWIRAKSGFEKLLWDGTKYRIACSEVGQLVDEAKLPFVDDIYATTYRVGRNAPRMELDEALHTDALNGEAFAQMVGLPPALDRERVRTMLSRIIVENFHTDGRFLANGSSPGETFPDEWPFCQWTNAWTGTEYFFAAQLFTEGMVSEGLRLIEQIYLRKSEEGMRFNHNECGDHYSRPLSIFAAYVALLGLDHDVSAGVLRIVPPGDKRAWDVLFLTPLHIGKLRLIPDEAVSLEIVSGESILRTLVLPNWVGNFSAKQQSDNDSVKIISRTENDTEITFDPPLYLKSGAIVEFFPETVKNSLEVVRL